MNIAAIATIEVVGVEDNEVFLPCDLTPPDLDEVVHLVLWYKGDQGEPLYR